MNFRLLGLAALTLVSNFNLLTGRIEAASLPAGFNETQVVGSLANPTAMALAPDGRIFVCQQGGALRVVKNDVLLSTPFVSLSVDSAGERGLLGVAFDPNFANNQWVYLYYTVPGSPAHNRVSRFTASGDVAIPGSETILLELNSLSSAQNHNGGALHFGLDGKLYIAVGENANSANAQTLGNLLGKVLRLNPDGSIPTDNPFYNSAIGVNRAIWALGLRNPFTFAVQPGTGRMFINDVGQDTWEEINDGRRGANYGWPNCEGTCGSSTYVDPIFQYSHGPACAIVGGDFYNPASPQFPSAYLGVYFFADLCGGWIHLLDPNNGNQVSGFATGISSPVDLRVSADGSLYYLERGGGGLYRVRYSSAPAIVQHPQNQSVSSGATVTFSVVASGSPPLTYQWQRNGVDIAGATGSSYTFQAQAQDNGATYRCRVSNSFGSVTSNPATLTINNNQPPVAIITSPTQGTRYNAGNTILFSGRGTDPESGELPATALSWTVEFHHDTHLHPFLGPIDDVANGSFVIPNRGETSANVYYRILLTATDSAGAQSTSYVDIIPNVANLTFLTDPAGLDLTVDGQPVPTPYAVASVVGMIRTLGAPNSQRLDRTWYDFSGWSDGGSQTHEIQTPAVDTSYTAFSKRRGRK